MDIKQRNATYKGIPVTVYGEPEYISQGVYAGKFGVEIKMLVDDAKAIDLHAGGSSDYVKYGNGYIKFGIIDLHNLIYDDVEDSPLPFE